MSTQKRPYFLEVIAEKQPVRGLVLCHHGLNQNPKALHPLLGGLASQGFRSFLIHGPGHDHSGGPVNAEAFQKRYFESYQFLQNQFDLPVHFLGYSFGGLIGIQLFESCRFDSMALIAPALKLRLSSHMIRSVLPFVSKVHSLSLGEEQWDRHYRFHQNGVPVEVYKSFFNIYSELHQRGLPDLGQTPTLVAAHPRDELINTQFLQRWVLQYEKAEFLTLDNSQAELKRFNHLSFDSQTLGETQFQCLLNQINKHFT